MQVLHPDLEVLLPVHNEGESIEETLREIYHELSPHLAIQFIVTEDGSTDNTEQILTRLRESFPMKLIMSPERKGYAKAVIDGMEQSEAPYLLCLDSDGQCDPKDFWKFWESRGSHDVLIGWRVNRKDNFSRKAMSGTFRMLHKLIYRVPIHDPSCPFVLAQQHVIKRLVPELGEMKQGFWWEFVARVHRRGYSITELPVNHRQRLSGQTRVYHLSKLPRIGLTHLIALFKIWFQTKRPSE